MHASNWTAQVNSLGIERNALCLALLLLPCLWQPLQGFEIVGLADGDEEDDGESEEGDSEGDEEGFAEERGEGEEGARGSRRQRRPPRRQAQEVTCRVS